MKKQLKTEEGDPNYVVEQFWSQLMTLAAHNKTEEAKKMYDPLFYLDVCGTFINSSYVFDRLTNMTKTGFRRLVHKPKSARDYGNVIQFTVNMLKRAKFIREEVYILHKVNRQLVNGKVKNCKKASTKKPVGRKM